ncbi:MAG: helix-turn-helix domain-containing protein [Pseudomonadota bacterium]
MTFSIMPNCLEIMPDWTKTGDVSGEQARSFGVLLFERFSNHCLANAIEPFRAANTFLGRKAYSWRILTLDGAPVSSSSGFPVMPECALAEAPRGDALFVMPSYGFRSLATPKCLRALQAAARRYRVLAGLDSGSWLLAEAGLLGGRAATIHFEEFDAFAERFPDVDARRERWVIDGDRLSAGGAATAYELATQLIERDYGAALTLEIASLFMQGDHPGGGSGDPNSLAPKTKDRKVRAALAEMLANLETPLSVADLAKAAACRSRELERRFTSALGAPPRTVYRRLRLLQARRWIVDSDLGVSEVALRSGYRDPSAFTRAFKAEFGASPQRLRRSWAR